MGAVTTTAASEPVPPHVAEPELRTPAEVYDPSNWPRWAFVACSILIGAFTLWMVALAERPGIVGPLAVVVAMPWLYYLVDKHPPPWLILTATMLPLLALNTVLYDAAGNEAAAIATVIAIYVQGESIAVYEPRWALMGDALGGAVVVSHVLHGWGLPALYLIGFSGVSIAAGYLMRKQQATLVELRATQAQLVGEAKLQERQRVAREIHDVVAHSLTVTMMHLTAARMAVLRDPAAAVESLEEAERVGRGSLTEIRGTVSLLRSGDERPTDPALPTGADILTLIEGYRLAGVDITCRSVVDLAAFPPNEGLTLYRLLQEAVANAVRHAPDRPVEIRLETSEDQLEVQVTNLLGDGPAGVSTGGNGLQGMRERVELAGGRLTVGPDDGRWHVRATLPRSGQRDGRRCR